MGASQQQRRIATHRRPPMTNRNPPWVREELILALELYLRRWQKSTIGHDDPEVVELSRTLNGLPIHEDRPDATRFRNPNGVYMKLANFARLDPAYPGEGLTRGNRLERAVWDEFAGDPVYLQLIAQSGAMPPSSIPCPSSVMRTRRSSEYRKGVCCSDLIVPASETSGLLGARRQTCWSDPDAWRAKSAASTFKSSTVETSARSWSAIIGSHWPHCALASARDYPT
jgi:hypothetical protein